MEIQVVWASTVWKVSKYGVISGPYFPVFSPNTRKYGPEIAPYFDTFRAVQYSKWKCASSDTLGLKTVNKLRN